MAHALKNTTQIANIAAYQAFQNIGGTQGETVGTILELAICRVYDELMAAVDPNECNPGELLDTATLAVTNALGNLVLSVSAQIADNLGLLED